MRMETAESGMSPSLSRAASSAAERLTVKFPPVIRPTGTLLPIHSRAPLATNAGHTTFANDIGIGDMVPVILIAPPLPTEAACPDTETPPPAPLSENSLSRIESVPAL